MTNFNEMFDRELADEFVEECMKFIDDLSMSKREEEIFVRGQMFVIDLLVKQYARSGVGSNEVLSRMVNIRNDIATVINEEF